MFYIQGLFLLNVTRAKQKNEHLNSIGREQQSWQGHCYLPFILRKETIVIIKMSSAADNSINTASFKGIRWYQEWCLKPTHIFFLIFTHLLTAGPPRLARPPLPIFWILICSYKKQWVKIIWDRILGLAWLKFAVASLNSENIIGMNTRNIWWWFLLSFI